MGDGNLRLLIAPATSYILNPGRHKQHQVGTGSVQSLHKVFCAQTPQCLSTLDIAAAHTLAHQACCCTSNMRGSHRSARPTGISAGDCGGVDSDTGCEDIHAGAEVGKGCHGVVSGDCSDCDCAWCRSCVCACRWGQAGREGRESASFLESLGVWTRTCAPGGRGALAQWYLPCVNSQLLKEPYTTHHMYDPLQLVKCHHCLCKNATAIVLQIHKGLAQYAVP
jgi:hypothetical protein